MLAICEENMMFTFAYPAVFKRDEGRRLLVSFPDFPTAHTDGAEANEAMEEAIDCLGSSIAFAMADKAEVPKPSRLKRGQKLVPVPLWIVGKLALYWTIREIGISQSELARRLNVRETVVRRMLDPNHDTRPEKLQAALEALGKRVVMAYGDAA
jgi:antitoxin HicB